jgi:lysophospholipase L1-like esterase
VFMTRKAKLLIVAVMVFLMASAKAELIGRTLQAQNAGANAVPRPVEQTPINPKLPTLFIIGDSTVRNGTAGQQGWGDPIADYFDRTKINVVNRAIGGRSSRTFQTEGRWEQVVADLKRGDFVLMQFGHNDGGAINDTSRARGSLRGIGEEVEEINNLLTKKPEVVHTYGWYMRKYVADTKAKGATPIILSPVPRKIWKDGRIVRASEDYGKWAAKVAESQGAVFVDLNEIIARHYEAIGAEKVNALFADEHTHTNAAGAVINASSIIAGLKGSRNCKLCKYFSAQAKAVAAYREASQK